MPESNCGVPSPSAILQRPFLIVCPYFPLYSTRQTPRTITLICQRSWQVHCTHITLEGCSSGPRLGPWRPSSSSAASTSSSSTGEAAIAAPVISDPKKSQPHIIRHSLIFHLNFFRIQHFSGQKYLIMNLSKSKNEVYKVSAFEPWPYQLDGELLVFKQQTLYLQNLLQFLDFA